MRKKLMMVIFSFLFLLSIMIPEQSSYAAYAQGTVYVQVGSEKVLGTNVRVPVTLRYLTNRIGANLQISGGKFTIAPEGNRQLLTFQGFTPSKTFNGDLFQTFVSESSKGVTVQFTSTANGNNQALGTEVIGFVEYSLRSNARQGDQVQLRLTDLSLESQNGGTLDVTPLNGSVERNMRIGDVVGRDAVTPAAATRILQHVNRTKRITDPQALKSADVNSDGVVDLADATLILRYVAKLDKSFLAIKSTDIPFAAVNVDYKAKLEAVNGEEPYTWKLNRSRLPYGLELDAKTGEISGKVTREFDQKVEIAVQDVTGKTVTREFQFSAVKTDIKALEPIEPVTVAVGKPVKLPDQVRATLTDGTSKTLSVKWPIVDTKKLGIQTIKGQISGTKLTVNVQVIVTEDGLSVKPPADSGDLISNIEVKKFTLLNTVMHTIMFDSSASVFSAEISFGTGRNETVLNMLYDPGDENFKQPRFSRGTTKLQSNQTVTITAYDQFGKKIGAKTFILNEYLN